ncbi:MAG: peptidylprolyl isomerase [Planctomycetota bacterium]
MDWLALTPEQLAQYHVQIRVSIDAIEAPDLLVRLWAQEAPETVRNFLRLCAQGFYDGKTFHRILGDFMVQGGCPKGDGTGDSPLGSFADEFDPSAARSHRYGVLSMAHTGAPRSAGCQFFMICHDGPAAWNLDGSFASFGQLVGDGSALEALRSVDVAASPDGEPSLPQAACRIVFARIVPGSLADASAIVEPVLPEQKWGPPNTVSIESLELRLEGGDPARTEIGTRTLASQLIQRAEAGEPFAELTRLYSDDPAQRGEERPVGYHFARSGTRPAQGLWEVHAAQTEARRELIRSHAKQAGRLSSKDAAAARDRIQIELQRRVRASWPIPRSSSPPWRTPPSP